VERKRVHVGLSSLTRAHRLAAAFAFSLLVGLFARISVDLPLSPVPITGQSFAVLLCGALFGPRLAAVSLLMYLIEGALGLPVFAGGKGGIDVFFGATAGFLIAFPFAGAMVGYLSVRGWDRRLIDATLAMTLGTLLIMGIGALWLGVYLKNVGAWQSLSALADMAIFPYLPGAALKIVVAAGIVWALRRRLSLRLT